MTIFAKFLSGYFLKFNFLKFYSVNCVLGSANRIVLLVTAKINILGMLQNSLSTDDFPFLIKSVHDKNQAIGYAMLKP